MRSPRRRPNLNDRLRANKAALDFMADAAGKPRLDIFVKPKRKYERNTDEGELEKGVLNAVSALLSVHPKVALAVRQNSGAVNVQDANGRSYPIWFFRFLRRPAAMRITDFWGFMTDGRPFALEAKRRNWSGPHDIREIEQQAFIQYIRKIGGIGAFVRSSLEAQAALDVPQDI